MSLRLNQRTNLSQNRALKKSSHFLSCTPQINPISSSSFLRSGLLLMYVPCLTVRTF